MAIGLDQTATVYERIAGGAHTAVIKTGLACRIVSIRGTTATATQRTEMGRLRRFLYDPSYELPDNVQVEVDGDRWNPIIGTDAAPRLMGQLHHRSIDVVRAGT